MNQKTVSIFLQRLFLGLGSLLNMIVSILILSSVRVKSEVQLSVNVVSMVLLCMAQKQFTDVEASIIQSMNDLTNAVNNSRSGSNVSIPRENSAEPISDNMTNSSE